MTSNQFKHWDVWKSFTLHQAAMLWCEVDPNSEAEFATNLAYLSIKQAMQQALLVGELVADICCKDANHPYEIARKRLDGTDYLPVELGCQYPENDDVDWGKTEIFRHSLVRWAIARDLSPEFLRHDFEKRQKVAEVQSRETSRRSTYTTPLLDHLYAAIEEFWVGHDPKHPPKSKDIVAWLVARLENKSVRAAEAIDLIIRSEQGRLGGNRRVSADLDDDEDRDIKRHGALVK